MDNSRKQSLLDFVDSIGDFIEYWGFKKVHGRIWALTYLNDSPIDANYLMENLKISKALTSMSIKELLQYNVLLEVKKSRPETQKYKANPDITSVIMKVLKDREMKLLKQIHQNFNKVKKNSHNIENLNPLKLDEVGTMISTAQSVLSTITQLGQVDFKDIDESFTQTKSASKK